MTNNNTTPDQQQRQAPASAANKPPAPIRDDSSHPSPSAPAPVQSGGVRSGTKRILRMLGSFCAVLLSVTVAVGADVPDLPGGHFGGFYKVTSSNDPLFPETARKEYFLDFGRGIQGNKLSGSVAVSVRQNPNVKVRFMVWQYFPDQGTIMIGNPTVEDPRKVVARGVWRMKGTANGVLFERGRHRVVLQRANPTDY